MGFSRLGAIICEYCDYRVTDEWSSITDARKTMKHYGWSVVKNDGERDDICPNCRLQQNNSILPICKEEDLVHCKEYLCLSKVTSVQMVLFWDKEKKVFSQDGLAKTSSRTFKYEDFEWVCHRKESW